eukprot:3469148-Amphidinium_carterae.1
MSDLARLQNEQHTNSEWKQLRLEKEARQGYSRRKHAVTDTSRFEGSYYAEQRSAKSRGRGTGWQERVIASSGAAVPPVPTGSGLQITDGGDDLTLWQREASVECQKFKLSST